MKSYNCLSWVDFSKVIIEIRVFIFVKVKDIKERIKEDYKN